MSAGPRLTRVLSHKVFDGGLQRVTVVMAEKWFTLESSVAAASLHRRGSLVREVAREPSTGFVEQAGELSDVVGERMNGW
jgi:hypothetical protein